MEAKKISENITLISVFLIFIGYYNYYSYYSFFDIEIHSFLTTGELLLSFLPISIYILITFIIIFIMIALSNSTNNEDKVTEGINESYYKELKTSFNNVIFRKRPITIREYLSSLFSLLLRLFGILLLLLVTFIFIKGIVEKNPTLYDSKNVIIFFLIIWYAIIDTFFEKKILKSKLILDKRVYNISSILVLLLTIITLTNLLKAHKIESGNALYNVEFSIKDEKIKTDNENIYVGMTQEYLFIRNISKKNNIVYKRCDLSDFSIVRIRHNEKKE